MSEALWCFVNKDKEPNERAPKMFPNSKYNNSGRSQKNGQSKRLQGWSQDSYVCFNKLYTRVQNYRLRQANFETELLAVWHNSDALMTPNIREVAVEEEDILPADDLTGLIAPTQYVARRIDLEDKQISNKSSDDDVEDPYDHNKV
jgi:hypothetical protein